MLKPSSGLCFEDRGARSKLPKREVAAERELEEPPEVEMDAGFGAVYFGVGGFSDLRAGELQLELEPYPAVEYSVVESPAVEMEPEVVVLEHNEVLDPRVDDSESWPEPTKAELAFLSCREDKGDG